PAARENNHFYDPIAKHGLRGGERAPIDLIVETGITGVGAAGVGAPDWITAKENDVGIARFWTELEKSVTAAGPAERGQDLAMALLCAGAMMHVLEDLGVPARTRGDLDEFLLPLGGGSNDRGSRFERLAAVLFGRLGVPAATAPVPRPKLRDFFTADDHQGLADIINARFYSLGTLPRSVNIPAHPRPGELAALVAKASKYPSPKPTRDPAITGGDARAIRDADGVGLANYRVTDEEIHFLISDHCPHPQLALTSPLVAAH